LDTPWSILAKKMKGEEKENKEVGPVTRKRKNWRGDKKKG